jgi:hypothetical protein
MERNTAITVGLIVVILLAIGSIFWFRHRSNAANETSTIESTVKIQPPPGVRGPG